MDSPLYRFVTNSFTRLPWGLAGILLWSQVERSAWRRSWHVNIARCRATSRVMVVHFNRLADGGFLPASYRRLDGPADLQRDRPLLEGAIIVFLEAAAKAQPPELIPAATASGPAGDKPRRPVFQDATAA